MTTKYNHKNRAQYDREKERESRAFVREFKNKPCLDCGKSYPPEVMEFDHLRDKSFVLSKVKRHSKQTIIDEINKCELVCANCHRIRTFSRRRNQSEQTTIINLQLNLTFETK